MLKLSKYISHKMQFFIKRSTITYLFCRYIQEQLGIHELDPMYREFALIFETFRIAEPEKLIDSKTDSINLDDSRPKKLIRPDGDDDMEEEDEEDVSMKMYF